MEKSGGGGGGGKQQLATDRHRTTPLVVGDAFRYGWGHLSLDVTQAIREARRNKVQYSIGCTSVFVVVLLVAVMTTALSYSPTVFLSLAEASDFEADLYVSGEFVNGYSNINYTAMEESVRDIAPFHAPRQSNIWLDAYQPESCIGFVPSQPSNVSFSYSHRSDLCPDVWNGAECIRNLCGVTADISLYLLDSRREKLLGLGRSWPYEAVPIGEAYVHETFARALGDVAVSDIVVISMDVRVMFPSLFEAATNYSGMSSTAQSHTFVNIPLRISQIFTATYGKYPKSIDRVMILDFATILETVAPHLHDAGFSDRFISLFRSADVKDLRVYESINSVLFACAANRVECYTETNYPELAKRLVDWASRVVDRLGYTTVNGIVPVLSQLNNFQFFSAFLNLIFTLVTLLLCALSIFLIYSLLMVSVETRTFELGIFRMVGMDKLGIVSLILVQALSFSLPAWVFGLIGAQLLWILVRSYLIPIINVNISMLLSVNSVLVVTGLGLIVPILAAILPIRNALTGNLHDALDRRRSRTKAIIVNIERSRQKIPLQQLASGLLLTIFGFGIYYFLPLALVYQNITLMFNIFLTLLMGMLVGLVMLSLNVQPLVERILVRGIFMVLFLELRCMPKLVVTNLIAHRARNRKTTIMYALSLGFLIFITVVIRIELTSLVYLKTQELGAPIVLRSTGPNYNSAGIATGLRNALELEAFCMQNPSVANFAFATVPLDQVTTTLRSASIGNIGRVLSYQLKVYGGAPNLLDNVDPMYIRMSVATESSEFGLSERMYTWKGSHSFYLGSFYLTALSLQGMDDPFVHQLKLVDGPRTQSLRSLTATLSFVDAFPLFKMSPFPSAPNQDASASYTTFLSMMNGEMYSSARELPLDRLLIYPNSSSADMIDDLVRELDEITADTNIFLLEDALANIGRASETLTLIFQMITGVIMTIAFFSLNSSVYTNIMEQMKEIGILRALGINRYGIFRLYAYESFSLILSSAILGTVIGVIVGWSMASQRSLLTGVPLTFVFPSDIFLIVFCASMVSCVLSTLGPVLQIVLKEGSIVPN